MKQLAIAVVVICILALLVFCGWAGASMIGSASDAEQAQQETYQEAIKAAVSDVDCSQTEVTIEGSFASGNNVAIAIGKDASAEVMAPPGESTDESRGPCPSND
jgi:type II secretory pathway pseudopilin PulG